MEKDIVSVNHQELKEMLKQYYKVRKPVFIWGYQGIGKSYIVRELAQELEIELIDIRASQLDPSDVRGIPFRTDGRTQWLVPEWLPSEGKGIIFLDEFNQAPPLVQSSFFQLILDRKIGNYTLPKDWVVFCAGNPAEVSNVVFELPAPLLNRMGHVWLNIPSADEWINNFAIPKRIDSRIIGFVKFKESLLWKYEEGMTAYPTPRTWELCSNLIKEIPDKEIELIKRLSASAVGMPAAIQFSAFVKAKSKINIDEILEKPELIKEIPEDEIGTKYAVLTELPVRFEKDRKVLSKIVNVLKMLDEPEWQIMVIRMCKEIDAEQIGKMIYTNAEFRKMARNLSIYL